MRCCLPELEALPRMSGLAGNQTSVTFPASDWPVRFLLRLSLVQSVPSSRGDLKIIESCNGKPEYSGSRTPWNQYQAAVGDLFNLYFNPRSNLTPRRFLQLPELLTPRNSGFTPPLRWTDENNAADLIHNHQSTALGHQTGFKITTIDQYRHNGSAKIQMNVFTTTSELFKSRPTFVSTHSIAQGAQTKIHISYMYSSQPALFSANCKAWQSLG